VKLSEALSIGQKAPAGATSYPVLLACGFSPLHLQTFLRGHMQRLLPQRTVEISTGLYGSLADTLEQLPAFSGEAAAVFIEWSDLDPRLGYRSLGGWGKGSLSAETTLARLASAMQLKPPALRMVVSLPTLPLPPGFHTTGWQASAAELALESALAEFASKISLLPALLVLNRQRLPQDGYDFRSDLNTGFPYSIKHTDLLAEAVAGLLTLPPPKKGLISDLDDTMWRGIVGEEGADSVCWDLAGHAQMHGFIHVIVIMFYSVDAYENGGEHKQQKPEPDKLSRYRLASSVRIITSCRQKRHTHKSIKKPLKLQSA